VWNFAPVIVWLSLFVYFNGRMRVFLIFVTLIGLYFVEILTGEILFISIVALVGMWIFAEFVGGLSQVLGWNPMMQKEKGMRWKKKGMKGGSKKMTDNL